MSNLLAAHRYLIVNADDFGASEGVNRGILHAHQNGIVTSTSLMVRQLAAEHAVELARGCPSLGIGLHLDLCEWELRDGVWVPQYEVVDCGDAAAVKTEVRRQLEEFRRLLGADPTHLDSHQHVHRRPPVTEIMLELSDTLEAPLRGFDSDVRYDGSFYGQGAEGEPLPENLSVAFLNNLFADLPLGVTELGCHPGFAAELKSAYCHERDQEVQVLCYPSLQATLTQLEIELCSFSDLTRIRSKATSS